jgi:DNA-binding NarL/FixJ family response regulator
MTKILVIEDEPHLRANLVTILQMENYRVTSARNGQEGIGAARTEKPDLVLCDIMMPGLDGFGVLKEIRQNETLARVPFIFITAKSERADLRAGMESGADDYLTKPFTVPELLSAIQARFLRCEQQRGGAKATFESPEKLQDLGLTPRQAQVLFWMAQGKTNAEIGMLLQMSLGTVKKHAEHIFFKLGVENRSAAIVRTMEFLR